MKCSSVRISRAIHEHEFRTVQPDTAGPDLLCDSEIIFELDICLQLDGEPIHGYSRLPAQYLEAFEVLEPDVLPLLIVLENDLIGSADDDTIVAIDDDHFVFVDISTGMMNADNTRIPRLRARIDICEVGPPNSVINPATPWC